MPYRKTLLERPQTTRSQTHLPGLLWDEPGDVNSRKCGQMQTVNDGEKFHCDRRTTLRKMYDGVFEQSSARSEGLCCVRGDFLAEKRWTTNFAFNSISNHWVETKLRKSVKNTLFLESIYMRREPFNYTRISMIWDKNQILPNLIFRVKRFGGWVRAQDLDLKGIITSPGAIDEGARMSWSVSSGDD